MIKHISLCIPYYNTFDLTKQIIDILIKSKFINEIMFSDDCLSEPFVYNHRKVKIYRNSINLGVLKKKFNAVKYAFNRWIYLLDSDNFIKFKVLNKSFKDLKNKKLNKNYYYSSSRLILKNIDVDKKLHNKVINYNFKHKIINFNLVKQYLGKVRYFNFLSNVLKKFLVTGNYSKQSLTLWCLYIIG
jgi:hypothetical protein